MAAPQNRLSRSMDKAVRDAGSLTQQYDPWNPKENGFDYDGRQMGHHGTDKHPAFNKYM